MVVLVVVRWMVVWVALERVQFRVAHERLLPGWIVALLVVVAMAVLVDWVALLMGQPHQIACNLLSLATSLRQLEFVLTWWAVLQQGRLWLLLHGMLWQLFLLEWIEVV